MDNVIILQYSVILCLGDTIMSDLVQILLAIGVLGLLVGGILWFFRGPEGVSKQDKARVHDRDYTSHRINSTKSSYDETPRE
jgi:hypothetical protein